VTSRDLELGRISRTEAAIQTGSAGTAGSGERSRAILLRLVDRGRMRGRVVLGAVGLDCLVIAYR
jgi:hypothetical protein